MSKAESLPQSDVEPQQGLSLKRRALKGSAITFAGYGASQVLRLGSNLILTRLLFPEVFGLMALVQTFLIGLQMFSDIGINLSIIQNKRGNDPAFLNTAWTVQVVRGGILWLGACLLASPVAEFYQEPMLSYLLPVSGATAFISGMNSTKLATANRQINLGRLTLLEFTSQVIGISVMLIGAWMFRSVWVLVIGGMAASLIKMIASHIFLEGHRNRLHWEKEAFHSIFNFGIWIFLSTVLGFLSSQSDRLLIGRFASVEFLGIYTIALTMSQVPISLNSQVENSVLLPSYSELTRENPGRLRSFLWKTRLTIIGIGWSLLLPLVIFGGWLVDFLYDDRYREAGWMLQVLSTAALMQVVNASYGPIFIATGKVFIQTALITTLVTLQILSAFIGGYLWGENGIIVGFASVHVIFYPVYAIFLSRISLWQPKIDIPAIAIILVVAGVLYRRLG